MVDFFVRIPFFLGLPVFCLMMIGLGLGALFIFRWILRRFASSSDSDKPVTNVFRVCGALLGLLLSLTFASVQSKIWRLRDAVELEAAQIVDIHTDLNLYESDAASAIQGKLIAYANTLIEDEWEALSRDRLSPEAQALFADIQTGVLDLAASTPRQTSLRANLLQDVDEISDHRQTRLHHATSQSPVFLPIALFGFVIVSALFAVHKLDATLVIYVSLYCIFIGVVLYFILAMNDPFQGVVRVSSEPIQTVYDGILATRRH